jgi:hypothetical protein
MSFIDYIKEGNLDKAKQFLQENPKYNIHVNDEKAFRLSCYYGHLEVARWLWDISNNKINIYAKNEDAFCSSCMKGHLEVARWLWDISNHKINIHAYGDYAFRWSCFHCHLDVAKWLLSLDFDYFLNWIKENEFNGKIKLELQNTIDEIITENMIQSRPQINKETIIVI